MRFSLVFTFCTFWVLLGPSIAFAQNDEDDERICARAETTVGGRVFVARVWADPNNETEVFTPDGSLEQWHVDELRDVQKMGSCKLRFLPPITTGPATTVLRLDQGKFERFFTVDEAKKQIVEVNSIDKQSETFSVLKSTTNGVANVGDQPRDRSSAQNIYRWNGSRYQLSRLLTPIVTTVSATSELKRQGDFLFDAEHAVDGAPDTSWSEGEAGPGINAELRITFDSPYALTKLRMLPGCGGEKLWLSNQRIKKIQVTYDDSTNEVLSLEDATSATDWKTLTLAHAKPTARLAIKVLEVYPAKWKDACISEIAFEWAPVTGRTDIAKAPSFLGLNCDDTWVAAKKRFGLDGATPNIEYLSADYERLRAIGVTSLDLTSDGKLKTLGVSTCEDRPRDALALPSNDLETQLCHRSVKEIRELFGEPALRRSDTFPLEYAWGGGSLKIDFDYDRNKVRRLELSCPTR